MCTYSIRANAAAYMRRRHRYIAAWLRVCGCAISTTAANALRAPAQWNGNSRANGQRRTGLSERAMCAVDEIRHKFAICIQLESNDSAFVVLPLTYRQGVPKTKLFLANLTKCSAEKEHANCDPVPLE